MATRNIVPRGDEEGNLGTALKKWLKGWFKDLHISGDLTDGTYTTTMAAIVAGASVFGKQYQKAESEGESSTTSTSYQQKLRLTTPTTLPAGKYRIGWHFLYGQSSIVSSFRGRVQLDDGTDLTEMQIEIQDTANYVPTCGFKEVELTAGEHTIDIDFNASGNTSYIKLARLELWRVE